MGAFDEKNRRKSCASVPLIKLRKTHLIVLMYHIIHWFAILFYICCTLGHCHMHIRSDLRRYIYKLGAQKEWKGSPWEYVEYIPPPDPFIPFHSTLVKQPLSCSNPANPPNLNLTPPTNLTHNPPLILSLAGFGQLAQNFSKAKIH